MASNLDPKIDYVFKRICGDEDNAPLLVDLLNAVLRLPAGRPVRGVMLLNPFVARDYVEGKVPVLDVRARDDVGRQFLLEMQRFVRPAFDRRLLYYWASGHAEQLLKGERYEMLQPTYLICLVNETLFPDEPYHHCFRALDAEHGVVLCKDLEIHVLELSKFAVPVEEVRSPLERWCYFFKHGASLDLDNLPATLDVPVIRKAVEVLVKASQEEIERHRAAERLKGERDAADLLATARMTREEWRAEWREEGRVEGFGEGLEKGIEQGLEKGIEKGKLIGRIQLLQQLLQQPEAKSAELNRLSDQALAQLEESLKRQLSGTKRTNGTPPTDQP